MPTLLLPHEYFSRSAHASTIAGHHQQTENTAWARILNLLLWWNVSIPDTDLACHPAHLTVSAEKGHQGVINYCSLNTIGQSHMSPYGCHASWQTTQAAVFSIFTCCVAAQCNWTYATKSTDKKVTEARAKAGAPLSCLDICPIAACTWLMGDHWVRHFGLLDLIIFEHMQLLAF